MISWFPGPFIVYINGTHDQLLPRSVYCLYISGKIVTIQTLPIYLNIWAFAKISVPIKMGSSEGSCKSAHMGRFARTFAAGIHKGWM